MSYKAYKDPVIYILVIYAIFVMAIILEGML